MKPFNLEAAKAGKPIMFRDGEFCQFIAYEPKAQHAQQLILMTTNGNVFYREKCGRSAITGTRDIVMAPTKKTYWANIHKDSCGPFIGRMFSNCSEAAEEAERLDKAFKLIRTISFEIEE